MSLKLQVITEERSTIGIKVRALAKSLEGCESIRTFQSNFTEGLKAIRTGNNTQAEVEYKTVIAFEFTPAELLQIWHGDRIVLQLYTI